MTRSPTLLEAAVTVVFIPIAALSVVGLLLAELGLFTLGRAATGAAALSAAGWTLAIREWRSGGSWRPRDSWASWLLIVAALAAAVVLYIPPAESLVGGRDDSVYLAVGNGIARTGAIRQHDWLLALLPDDARSVLLSRQRGWPYLLSRFPGGVRIAAGTDVVVPDFFHQLSVWIAMFVSAAGPYGAYWVNVPFAALSLVLIGLIGRRAWSPIAGVVAVLLLAVNFGQIWYARMACSEVLTQWFVLSAVFFTLLACDQQSKTAAACAGAATGLAACTRIDALLVLLPLGVVWLVVARRKRLLGKAWSSYAVALGLVSAHALAQALLVCAPYTGRLAAEALQAAGRTTPRHWLLAGSALTAAAALALAIRRRMPLRHTMTALAAAAALVLATSAPDVVTTAWVLLTPAGLAAVAVGLLLSLWRDREQRLVLVAVPFAAEALFWLAWREPSPWPWGFRRFVPAVMPLGWVFAGVLISELAKVGPLVRRVVWLLPVTLATLSLAEAWPVLREPPMRGVHEQVDQIANQLPANAVVLTDRTAPNHLPLALQYTFGREVILVSAGVRPGAMLQALVERVTKEGRPVYLLIGSYDVDEPRRLWRTDFERLAVQPAGVASVQYTTLADWTAGARKALRTRTLVLERYTVLPPEEAPALDMPRTLDVGDRDFAFVLRGFYGQESMPTARARWTAEEAQIAIPRLRIPHNHAVKLVLRLAAWRPAGCAPPQIRLSIDGEAVGTIQQPGPGFAVYEIRLEQPAVERLRAAPSVLTLASTAFVPRTSGAGTDDRVLGVALDWVRLE